MAGTAGTNISPMSIPVKASLATYEAQRGTIRPMEKATHQIILAQSTEVHSYSMR